MLGKIVLGTYRFGNWIFYQVKVPVVRQLLWFVYTILDLLFVRIMSNAEIPAQCRIGRNLRLPHGGNGIILHWSATLGDDVTLYHQVTVGKRGKSRSPQIGNRVFIGAGAKILGSVTVSDDAKVGANAVVLEDVPAGATVVGVPGRIVSKSNSSENRHTNR